MWGSSVRFFQEEEEEAGGGGKSNNMSKKIPELQLMSDDDEPEEGTGRGIEGGLLDPCFGLDGKDHDEYLSGVGSSATTSAYETSRSERIDGTALLTRCDTHAAITGSVGLGPVDVAKNIWTY